MTQATDNDLKELKDLVTKGFAESKQQFNDLDKKMAVGFAELSGKIDKVDTKVEALDKRVEKIEFVFRNVLISVVVAVLIGILRILWIYPFDFKP